MNFVGNIGYVFRGRVLNCSINISSFRFWPTIVYKKFSSSCTMAKSKYEYVKNFEVEDRLTPNCWIVVTLDGKYFQRFSEVHGYEKPNDKRALELMSRSAAVVMEEMRDICLAYGQSDEYSFVFRKDTNVFNRRSEKILTIVNSIFTSSFVYYWKSFFGFMNMLYTPAFESHIFLFPSELNLKDYLSWRQTELHANNLYSSAFWAMVLKGKITPKEAEDKLRPIAFSPHKHEAILKEHGIVYMNEPLLFRKGTTLIRKLAPNPVDGKLHPIVFPFCCDITGEEFWKENPEILSLKPVQLLKPGGMPGLPAKRQINELNGDINAKLNQKSYGSTSNVHKSQVDVKIKLADRTISENMLSLKKE